MAECCCAAVKASFTVLSTVLNVWDASAQEQTAIVTALMP